MSENKQVWISALACGTCGAPMYPDMKAGGFRCLYCDNVRPFAVTFEDFAPEVKFRHKPVEIVEGMLKLGHVAIEDKEALEPPPQDERAKRLQPPELKILLRDKEAYEAMHDKRCHEITCPCCGQQLRSLQVEGIFTCPYCSQKFGERERMAMGKFDERLVVGRKLNLYRKAAMGRMQELAQHFPEEMGHVSTEKMKQLAEKEMAAAYIPVQLADLRWKMKVDCEYGSFTYYQECLNWAWPRSITYDIYLLDELWPWDYGELVPLKPAYFEDNVQLLAAENLGEWQRKIPNWVLQQVAPKRLRRAFGLQQAELRWVSRDLRQHSYGLVLLPIYYLEYRPAADRLARIMLNGQTGKAALQVITNEAEFTRLLEPAKKFPMSPESTILSPPIPVRYVKSPFLHERLEGDRHPGA